MNSEIKQVVVEKAKKIYSEGLNQRTFGNFSIKFEEKIAITPSSLPYQEMTPEDIIIVDLEGEKLEGLHKPSTETPLHVEVYKARDDLNALCHTHSPYATVFSCLREKIPATHNLMSYLGGEVQVAEYAHNGTQELGKNAVKALGEKKAVLLSNHGALVGGRDSEEAHYIASGLEFCAKMHYKASLYGEPEIVDEKIIQEMKKTYKNQLSDKK